MLRDEGPRAERRGSRRNGKGWAEGAGKGLPQGQSGKGTAVARVKRGVTKHRRHQEVLKEAKGFYSSRRRHFKAAKEAVLHARQYAYAHRRERKGDMRKLWILRIGAACRALDISYSQFIDGLAKAQVTVNRKVLAAFAAEEPATFAQLVERAKAALGSS